MGPTQAVIDRDAIRANLHEIRALLRPGTALLAVVKANAYGHGCIEAARILVAAGADALGVGYIQEGIDLRRAGIQAPVLVMGPTPHDEAEALLHHRLEPVLCDLGLAERLSSLASQAGRTVPVHLKVDTGMARLGVSPREAAAYAAKLAALPGIRLEGLMSHFACADAEDPGTARDQLARFLEADRSLQAAGVRAARRHLANSAGLLALPEAHLEMVRPGILLYAWPPAWPCAPP